MSRPRRRGAAVRIRGQREFQVRSDQCGEVRHRCEGRQERAERQVVLTPLVHSISAIDVLSPGARVARRGPFLLNKGTSTLLHGGSKRNVPLVLSGWRRFPG